MATVRPTALLFNKEEKSMLEDPLEFVLELLGVRFQKWLKLLRIIIIRLILIALASNFISLTLVISKRQLKQYAAVAALTQPGLCGLMASIGHFSALLNTQKVTHHYCWPIETCGEEIKIKILRASKYIKMYSAMLVLFSIMAHLLGMLPLVGDEKDTNAFMLLIMQYVTPWLTNWGLCLYISGGLLFSYGLAYPIVLFLYKAYQLHFQLELLNERLLRISDDYENVDESYVDNEDYQSVICERLEVCIKHHIRIIKLRSIYQGNLKFDMLYIPYGTVAPVAACYFIKDKISPGSDFRMVLVLILTLAIASALSIPGQQLTDDNARLCRVVSECPWVYWNTKNRKSLLLLLTGSMQPLTFASYAGWELNMRLLFMLLKWMYTLVTFFQ